MKRYTIVTNLQEKNFSDSKVTFSVEKMKSNNLVMVKPFLELYNSSRILIKKYVGEWWVVSKEYQPHYHTFDLDNLESTAYYRVGFIYDSKSDSDKLFFNHIQLSEGTVSEYHQPESNIPKVDVKFSNNFYANFYNSSEDTYLQVIRPYYNGMDTKTITKSKVTVLAPHLENEDDIDSPANVGLEFMNQTDQVIEILR